MKFRLCLIAAMFFFTTGIARAQSGCSDSPECPTPILAMVGAAGLIATRWLKK